MKFVVQAHPFHTVERGAGVCVVRAPARKRWGGKGQKTTPVTWHLTPRLAPIHTGQDIVRWGHIVCGNTFEGYYRVTCARTRRTGAPYSLDPGVEGCMEHRIEAMGTNKDRGEG
jgi:hypothetical protein